MDIPPLCTHEPAALMTLSAVRAFAGYPVTMPSVGIHAAITNLTTRSVRGSRTRHRPPEARLAAFAAQPPNLTPWPFMAVNFAAICPLVLPGRPRILCLFIESQLCYTLTSDDASRRVLSLHCPFAATGLDREPHFQSVIHAQHKKCPDRSPGVINGSVS